MNLMRSFSAALALIAVVVTPVLAQDAPQSAKRAAGPQIMKTFGGWDVRCFNASTPAPCDVWEAIAFKKGGNLAVSVSVVYVPSQNRHLMQFIVPLGVDIAKGAKLAQEQIKPLLNDDAEPELYRTYGHACHVAGDDIRAGEAYADATFLSGRPQDALGQLKRLLDRNDLDYYARARIEARIAEFTPIALEMQRRNLPQAGDKPDNGDSGQLGLHACAGDSCM